MMKRISILFAMLLGMTAFTLVACADGRVIPPEKLPVAAQQFVQQTFPGVTIAFAQKDGLKYEIHLNNGTEIEFDRKGIWDKVDCNLNPVPAALVPQPIAAYVTATFPGVSIVKIDKERYGYEIELSNDLELKFNKQGQLIMYDD